MSRVLSLIAVAVLVAGCLGSEGPAGSTGSSALIATAEPGPAMRYVAMGDLYTAGTGLPRLVDRWPNQLVRALRPGIQLQIVANLAGRGDGTTEVIEEQLPALEELEPGGVDLVTLLVGVNDIIIPRITAEEYREDMTLLLDGRDGVPGSGRDGLLDIVPADRVVLLTIPDFTLAPEVPRAFDRPGNDALVDAFNEVLRELAEARGVRLVDVSPIADLVPRDPTLIADDGQHPSAKQFAGWVELIAPAVREVLAQGPVAAEG